MFCEFEKRDWSSLCYGIPRLCNAGYKWPEKRLRGRFAACDMLGFNEKHLPERSARSAPLGQDKVEVGLDAPEAFGRASFFSKEPEAFGRGQPRPKTEDEQERGGNEEGRRAGSGNGEGEGKEAQPDKSADEEPEKLPFYRRPVLMTVLVGVVLVAGIGALLFWLHARHYEKTDDAFITGHLTRMSPRVGGQVIKVLIDDNQRVKRGDVLVELDPADYQASVDQASAELASAQGKLAEAQAEVRTGEATAGQSEAAQNASETEVERTAADLKRYEAVDLRAISEQQLDSARAAARSAQANLEAARKKTMASKAQVVYSEAEVKTEEANVQKARAALEQARLNLSYTRITAPEDGRITNKTVEPGVYAQPGQVLFSLVPLDVWVIANYKETQITDMRIGQTVSLKVDAYPDVDFSGRVDSFQSGTGAAFSLLPPENATGNYVKVVQRVPVKIVFDPHPDERYLIAPGMSVTPRVKVK
jgi:membrane fusion protein (multidrug efflux system)